MKYKKKIFRIIKLERKKERKERRKKERREERKMARREMGQISTFDSLDAALNQISCVLSHPFIKAEPPNLKIILLHLGSTLCLLIMRYSKI